MIKIHHKVSNKAGATLVEIMITVFMLTIGVLSSLMYFTAAASSTDLARDLLVASNHGEYILEEMHTRDSLANITDTDWSAWAQGAGLNTLNNETVTVTFADSAADPLNITTTVTWKTRLRANNITLVTEMTK